MSYKYYMRENVTGATTYDLETDFKGLRIVRVDGLEKYGEIKNIFEREYVEEQNIDYLYPTTPTFKPTTITIMFGIFERFITDSTTFAEAKDAFLEYIGTKSIVYWDTYRNKRAFMYRDGDIDITEDRRRNGDSFIQVTVKYKNTKGYVDNYDINNLMSFDTTWNVTSGNEITLPLRGTSPNEEVYIDWGDTSEIQTIAPMTILTGSPIKHTYSVTNAATKIRIWSTSTTSTNVGQMRSKRNSVVVRTRENHIVVTPNNGTLSHLKKFIGIEEVFEVDVAKHRRKGASNQSYTFDGRDLYAYIGARLACGQLSLEDVGPKLSNDQIVSFELPESLVENNSVKGSVEIYDERFGSLWTSILVEDFNQLKPQYGDTFKVEIKHDGITYLDESVLYGRAFNDVHVHDLILYVNSLNRVALALNQDSLVKKYGIGLGNDWTISITPIH